MRHKGELNHQRRFSGPTLTIGCRDAQYRSDEQGAPGGSSGSRRSPTHRSPLRQGLLQVAEARSGVPTEMAGQLERTIERRILKPIKPDTVVVHKELGFGLRGILHASPPSRRRQRRACWHTGIILTVYVASLRKFSSTSTIQKASTHNTNAHTHILRVQYSVVSFFLLMTRMLHILTTVQYFVS